MKSWIFHVARRLVRSGPNRRGGAAGLAIAGIAAGVATLVVVLAVMNGFQLGTIENILELNSFHIRIETEIPLREYASEAGTGAGGAGRDRNLDGGEGEAGEDRLRGTGEERSSDDSGSNRINGTDEIVAVVPFGEIQTLARGYWPDPQGIVIRAVPEEWLEIDTGAAEQIRVAGGAFDIATPGTIVIGSELSRALGARVGDTIAVTHIPAGGSRPEEVELTVAGLFRSGYLDFDRTWGFVSLATAGTVLNATDPMVYGIKIRDRFDVDRIDVDGVVRELRSAVNGGTRDSSVPENAAIADNGDRGDNATDNGTSTPTVATWREFNRGIFGALRMEKSMMIFLVGLIFLVVAGNIYQLLKRSILERSEEIAILRAIGAGAGDLRLVFVLEGWLIGVIGTFVGISIGLFISGTVNELFALLEIVTRTLGDRGMRVFSPAYFYIEEIPREIAPGELLAIAVGAIGVSVAAAGWAAAAVVRVQPMELLRNE